MLFAKIDPDGFFLGTLEADAVGLLDAIPLPDGHDLHDRVAAGLRPRWDQQSGQWQFVQPPTPEEQVEQPHALRAIAKGFAALRDHGVFLPPETLEWLAWYERSLDAQG